MKKILIFSLIGFISLNSIVCKKGFNPDKSKIAKAEINQKIQEYLSKAEKETDDNEKAKLLGAASELLCEKGDFRQAIQAARDAKRANPTEKHALASIGEFYIHEGKVKEAQIVLQEVISRDDKFGRAHYLLGNAFTGDKKLSQAENHYKRSISLDPDEINAYLNLAAVYSRNGNMGGALSILENAIKQRPGYAESYKNAGIIVEKMNKKAEAKKYYEEYIKLNPNGDDAEAVKLWISKLS